jgi:hypothetical protein
MATAAAAAASRKSRFMLASTGWSVGRFTRRDPFHG